MNDDTRAHIAPTEQHPLGRRTLTKGAAWTVPLVVVGVAAPAHAASQLCPPGTATLVNGTTPTQLTFPGTNVTATVAITATQNGQPTTIPGKDPNGIRTTGEVDAGDLILFFNEPDLQKQVTLTFTLTFSRPVTGATFRITDIDKDTGLWIDNVIVGPAGFTSVRGSRVTGTGTAADPFRSTTEGNQGSTDARAQATVTWPGAVQQVQVQYKAVDLVGDSANGQHIGITGIGFAGC